MHSSPVYDCALLITIVLVFFYLNRCHTFGHTVVCVGGWYATLLWLLSTNASQALINITSDACSSDTSDFARARACASSSLPLESVIAVDSAQFALSLCVISRCLFRAGGRAFALLDYKMRFLVIEGFSRRERKLFVNSNLLFLTQTFPSIFFLHLVHVFHDGIYTWAASIGSFNRSRIQFQSFCSSSIAEDGNKA